MQLGSRLPITESLAYDDVLLLPQYSAISSRKRVSTRTHLARNLELEVPIISSNMDTVTGSKQSIAMAQVGGIGFLHRFLPIDDEAAAVARVKRKRAHIIWDPYTISPDKTVSAARSDMREYEVGGLIVTESEQDPRVVGIVTVRDIEGENDDELVSAVMTPRNQMTTGDVDVSVPEARRLMHSARVEKLPLLDADDHCPGIIVMKDIKRLEDFPQSSIDSQGRYIVGASVGVVGDYLERAQELVLAGADCLVVDVAHAHSSHAIAGIRELHRQFADTPIVAGTVATAEGVRDLAKAGADSIRVGVGGGSACDTRQVAGAGHLMFTSVSECAEEGYKCGVQVIADGGIRKPADLSKAIGAGAHSAMLGSMLAGTDEAPGQIVERDGRKLKVYRGMASMGAFISKQIAEGGDVDDAAAEYTPEGVESVIPLVGPTAGVVKGLVGGLRSGMSYTGAETITEFHRKARFNRITSAGREESSTHILMRGERA